MRSLRQYVDASTHRQIKQIKNTYCADMRNENMFFWDIVLCQINTDEFSMISTPIHDVTHISFRCGGIRYEAKFMTMCTKIQYIWCKVILLFFDYTHCTYSYTEDDYCHGFNCGKMGNYTRQSI